MTNNNLSHAEKLLFELGITTPDEIDIEAIAWHVGAKIKYRPLEGCEALIVGNDKHSIISVNLRSPPHRRRFSIAHELGHWHYHRGKHLYCRSEDIDGNRARQPQTERDADRYAADLLMPAYLFKPIARKVPKVSFQSIQEIASQFETSLIATAIRFVEMGPHPCLLVCHNLSGRSWFTRSPAVPERWFPQEKLDPSSYAFDVLFGKKPDDSIPHKIGADAWFDRSEASWYEITEQTVKYSASECLTLLLLRDEKMLRDR